MIDEGVSASRVVPPSVPPMNTSVPSISSHTHTHTSLSTRYNKRNIRNITDWSLFLFNVTRPFVHWKSRDACSKAAYTDLFARYSFFSLTFFPLCTRLSKLRFRLEKRTRYVSNYESRAAFGYIDLWPLTRDDFFLFSFFPRAFIIILFSLSLVSSDILSCLDLEEMERNFLTPSRLMVWSSVVNDFLFNLEEFFPLLKDRFWKAKIWEDYSLSYENKWSVTLDGEKDKDKGRKCHLTKQKYRYINIIMIVILHSYPLRNFVI